MTALVSVITPTHRRPALLRRCIAGVAAQTYWPIEHLVVADGPDPAVASQDRVRAIELGRNWQGITGGWGAEARMAGTLLARGDLIAYCDDDNALHPDHLALLVGLIEQTGVDFVHSRMRRLRDGSEVGGEPVVGRIDTSLVLHRPECLRFGHWRPRGYESDGLLFAEWVRNGATHAHLPLVTVDYGAPALAAV